MDLTTYFEDAIIDHMLRGQAFTPPTAVYLALFTAAPSDAGGGTEVTGGPAPGYSRQEVTLDPASNGATANDAPINFTGLPAATITHAALFDAATAGTMLAWTAIDSRTVSEGATLSVATGALDFTID